MYASWEIYSKCNLACSHCYSTYHDEVFGLGFRPKTIGAPAIIQGLKNLSSAGIKQINLEGGEPTLMGNTLADIVRASKSYGLETIVSSHGMFLLKDGLIERLSSAGLDALSLSLDGATSHVNDSIRVNHSGAPAGQYDKAVEFLEWYGGSQKTFRLKINSVVRRDNLEDLAGLGALLTRKLPSNAPVQLKLVQMQPRGFGKGHYSRLCVSLSEFKNLVEQVAKECIFPVVHRSYDGGVYPFIVTTYDGKVTIPKGEVHEMIYVDGTPLNVLDDAFPAKLQDYLRNHPDFQDANSSINTYHK